MNNDRKKQHFIPQHILKHFIKTNGYKIQLDLIGEQNEINNINSKKTIMSKDYLFEINELNLNELENEFGKEENKNSPKLDKIIEKIKSNNYFNLTKEELEFILQMSIFYYFRSSVFIYELLIKDYSFIQNDVFLQNKIDNNLSKHKSEIILKMKANMDDKKYINSLVNTLLTQYNISLITTDSEFVLGDSYICVASSEYNTIYTDRGNCNIGMPNTLVLIPLTNKYYLSFYNSNDFAIRKQYKKLNNLMTEKINGVIYRNSFLYCISENKNILEDLIKNIFNISRYHIYTTKSMFKRLVYWEQEYDKKLIFDNVISTEPIDLGDGPIKTICKDFNTALIKPETKKYTIEKNIDEYDYKLVDGCFFIYLTPSASEILKEKYK